ncbi:MAG: hypothetical protein PHY02_06395 [Phycisphaerae bacterium]|nr:hypothetical protein [Phycisphaerae bacterium]
MGTKVQKDILTSRRIDTIKEWLDSKAGPDDINDLFVHIWPVECDKDLQGMTTCSAKADEKCLECKYNVNLPESWRIKDNYKPF